MPQQPNCMNSEPSQNNQGNNAGKAAGRVPEHAVEMRAQEIRQQASKIPDNFEIVPVIREVPIVIKVNTADRAEVTCALCPSRGQISVGPALFMAGTDDPVCRDCARVLDSELFQVHEVYRRSTLRTLWRDSEQGEERSPSISVLGLPRRIHTALWKGRVRTIRDVELALRRGDHIFGIAILSTNAIREALIDYRVKQVT